MKRLIIFGTGKIAECVSYYFDRENEYRVEAFCCDGAFLEQSSFNGRPVVAFENIEEEFPPSDYALFVALGYHGLNELRRRKFEEGLAKGYTLASYVSPNISGDFTVGANSLVPDCVTVQPRVSIGNNVFIWAGAMIGHHAVINDHCWVTGSANIGGLSRIGEQSFLGLNATVGHGVTLGSSCLLGANSLVTKCLQSESVVVVPDTETHRLNANQFLKVTTAF